MKKTLLAVLMVLMLCAAPAFGLGGGHPKGRPMRQPDWPEGLEAVVNSDRRVGGYFVNANDFFHYDGDAIDVNAFLAAAAAVKKTPLRIYLHEGLGFGGIPWHDGERSIIDYELAVLRRGWGPDAPVDPKAPQGKPGYVLVANVYLGRNVEEDRLKLPPGVTVTHAPNLSLAVRQLTPTPKVADEILIEFKITNNGKRPYTYRDRDYDRSWGMDEYRLYAKDAEGKWLRDPGTRPNCGGIWGEATLKPGTSFTRTIALNRWVLLKKPGRYEVDGRYHIAGMSHFSHGLVRSKPITVVVAPRTAGEMTAHIRDLSAELRAAAKDTDVATLVRKLMYTCDARITPALVDSMYAGDRIGNYWQVEALLYYLPDRAATKQAILASARKRGLTGGMLDVLRGTKATAEEMHPAIVRSLAPEDPASWEFGAQAAAVFRDVKYQPRMIAVATDPKASYNARTGCIFSMVWVRTDAVVAALRKLLKDPDKRIRRDVRSAIGNAYRHRARLKHPMRDDDFDAASRGGK